MKYFLAFILSFVFTLLALEIAKSQTSNCRPFSEHMKHFPKDGPEAAPSMLVAQVGPTMMVEIRFNHETGKLVISTFDISKNPGNPEACIRLIGAGGFINEALIENMLKELRKKDF